MDSQFRTETIKDIFYKDPSLTERELWLFFNLVWNLPKGKFLEVGTYKGVTARMLGKVCERRGSTLTCIDIVKDPDFDKNTKGLPVTFIKGDSTEVYTKFPDNSFDLIFIDGDHTSPVIGQDLDNYLLKLKKGGIFCGHDYINSSDVKEAVDARFKVSVYGSIWVKN